MATASDSVSARPAQPDFTHGFTNIFQAREALVRRIGKLDDDLVRDLAGVAALLDELSLLKLESEHEQGGRGIRFLAERITEMADELKEWTRETLDLADLVRRNDADDFPAAAGGEG